MFATLAARFRVVAIAEALSWTGLLIGMFFKYVVVGNELGVQIFGPIHGACFVLYVASVVLVRRTLQWDAKTTIWALIASIPPLGTVVFERWARRTGRIETAPAAAPASASQEPETTTAS
ncbi:DUF3817 domain-containing protein [Actinoalloteichus hymeniacidonis]|uniref:Integral membrane protein n=1 Tax=Actinoalloteichus hymeniacidonis TaxID=340345 RepID=A0AAC9HPT1_9PSEU|nr:DUF3817 domain-containing protein [Actinoalloteichus hymeniacidonis]AOS62315.1 integral membrane protein [Actinoalloteichus hymeniacidonis]MBB5909658.1 integral membrane protein [Actinoalloteichus hymeniacidonis]